LTGALREVDVVLRSKVGPYETVIAIEAAARSRRAAVYWVEMLVAKHKHLPTDKLVLVAEAGFTEQARTLARAEGVAALEPRDLAAGDPDYVVVSAVPTLWPKTVSLSPEAARVWVDRPGEGIKWFKAPPALDIVLPDGRTSDLLAVYAELYQANLSRIIEQIDLAQISENLDRFFVLRVGPGWTVQVDGKPASLYLPHVEGARTELHRIDALEFTGKATIKVDEVRLDHKQLADIDVRFAYGDGTFGGKPALFVVTENEHGGKLTIRAAEADGEKPA